MLSPVDQAKLKELESFLPPLLSLLSTIDPFLSRVYKLKNQADEMNGTKELWHHAGAAEIGDKMDIFHRLHDGGGGRYREYDE